jgi:sulfur carrier protein
MALTLTINGQSRTFAGLGSPVRMAEVVAEMDLKADRVAVELNGEIAPRVSWHETSVANGDRLEVVHFVGGGSGVVSCEAAKHATHGSLPGGLDRELSGTRGQRKR